MVKICKQCNESFYIHKGRKDQEFCSIQCRSAFKKITKVCPACKESFTIYKSVSERYNFCSMECKPKNAMRKFCLGCGKVFTASREDINHCSEKCRRPPVYINCLNCSKEFRICPSGKDIRRFCSFSCYRKYSGETSIEKIIRKVLDRLRINYIQEYQIGTYSIDFYLHENNICLEIDGQYWHTDFEKDQKRDNLLRNLGYKIIRIKELDIINSDNLDKLILIKLNIYASIQGEIVQRQDGCRGGLSTFS